jgi:hypothetical protein
MKEEMGVRVFPRGFRPTPLASPIEVNQTEARAPSSERRSIDVKEPPSTENRDIAKPPRKLSIEEGATPLEMGLPEGSIDP